MINPEISYLEIFTYLFFLLPARGFLKFPWIVDSFSVLPFMTPSLLLDFGLISIKGEDYRRLWPLESCFGKFPHWNVHLLEIGGTHFKDGMDNHHFIEWVENPWMVDPLDMLQQRKKQIVKIRGYYPVAPLRGVYLGPQGCYVKQFDII